MLMSSVISGDQGQRSKKTGRIFWHALDLFFTNSISDFMSDDVRRKRECESLWTVADSEAIKNLPTIETAVPFLDVSNNFFGSKIMVTGKNGKTSSSVQLQGTFPED